MTELTTLAGSISVNKTEFLELAQDILSGLVHGDASPVKDAITAFDDYLANAVDLDDTQKAGMMSDFLKDAYTQINQQAISASLDLLKTNEQLTLDSYRVQAEYNIAVANEAKLVSEQALIDAQKDKTVNDDKVSQEQILIARTNALEGIAKLRKQYGYGNAVYGDLVSTPATLGTSTDDGAIDKQITGYDYIRYQDTLKSMTELLSLLSNAGSEVPSWIGDAIKALTELATDGDVDIYTVSGDDPATAAVETSYNRAKVNFVDSPDFTPIV